MPTQSKVSKPLNERTILYYQHETKTQCEFYQNYSDWLTHTLNNEENDVFGNYSSQKIDSGSDFNKDKFKGVAYKSYEFNDFESIKNYYLKKIEYNTNSQVIYREGHKIHLRFVEKQRIKFPDKSFFSTKILVRHIIFDTKTNNFTHIRKRFGNRKWTTVIRVNDFSITKSTLGYFPFGTDNYNKFNPTLISTLLTALNFDINSLNGKIHEFGLDNLDKLLIQWFIKRNNINYDIPHSIDVSNVQDNRIDNLADALLNSTKSKKTGGIRYSGDKERAPDKSKFIREYQYLTYNRPPKHILKKYKTYSETLINYYKISNCDIISDIYDGKYYNLEYIGFLNNFLPIDKFNRINYSSFSQSKLPKLKRKYNIKFDDFNEIEKDVILNRINAYPQWLDSFLEELAEFAGLRNKSKYKITFNTYEELSSATVFLIEQKDTKKLRKSLKKSNISL